MIKLWYTLGDKKVEQQEKLRAERILMGRASIVSVFPRVIAHDAFYATDAWLYHYAKRILANVQGGRN